MIVVLFGQPHSGKTTLAQELEFEELYDYHIDGDHLRTMFKNTNYSKEGRISNLNRASDIATYLHYNGNDVVLSLVYPYRYIYIILEKEVEKNSMLKTLNSNT